MRFKNVISLLLIILLITSLFPLVSFDSKAQYYYNGRVTVKGEEGQERYYFRNEDNLYFNVYIEADGSGKSEEVIVSIERNKNNSILDTITVETSDDGTYKSWKEGEYFDLSDYGLGTYLLNITSPTSGDFQTSTFEIYESNYKKGSSIFTTDESLKERKHYFQKLDSGDARIYYKIKLLDQHGYPMPYPNRPPVNVKIKKGNDIIDTQEFTVNPDGSKEKVLFIEKPKIGDYQLLLFNNDGSIEFTRSEKFTITDINVDSPVGPGEITYTQGQNITLGIEGEYPKKIDIFVVNGSGEKVLHSWTEVQFKNGLWSKNYEVPEDIPDGIYHIQINDHESNEPILGVDSDENKFLIKKFDLEVYTNKESYAIGEDVRVFYTVSSILDGRSIEDVSVEWRASFDFKDEDTKSGSTDEDHFKFSIPEGVKESLFTLDIWANDTDGNSNHFSDEIYVGPIEGYVHLEKDQYLQGETIFVNVGSYISNTGSQKDRSPVHDSEVKVSLIDSTKDELSGYTVNTVTGDDGQVTVPLTLNDDIEVGSYFIKAHITKAGINRTYTSEFSVKDPDNRLTVYTDPISSENHYYPGDTVNIGYAVKKNYKEVDNANVKFKVYSSSEVYYYTFADDVIEFKIPKNYNPENNLKVDIFAKMDEGCSTSKTIEIPVKPGYILLNSDKEYFQAGDDIEFTFDYSAMVEPSEIYYKIIEKDASYHIGEEHLVEYGPVNESKFSFHIPEKPSESYQVEIELVTSNGYKFSDSIEIERMMGYDLDLELVTESDYITNVYKPGEKLKFKYELEIIGDGSIPDTITISYGFTHLGIEKRLETTDRKGTFSIDIPKKGDGEYILSASSISDDDYEIYDYETEIITVEKDPSWRDRKTYFGLSIFNLILLIIAVLALVLALFANLKGKSFKMPEMKETKKRVLKKKESEEEAEGKSAVERAHEWIGPKEEPEEESSGEQDEAQIEPEEPRW